GTRLTPRDAYSCCSRARAARRSTPCGRRAPRSFSLSGSDAANSIASRRRSSSGRARGSPASSSGSSSDVTTCIFARPMVMALPFPLIVRLAGLRRTVWLDLLTADSRTLAHIERREWLVLIELRPPFAHQFEGRREARRKHRRRVRRLDDVLDQIGVQPRPISRLSDQTLERLARLGQRPYRALGEAHACERVPLALLGIGRQEVVERRRPFRMLDMGDRLGLAAAEHVAIELWTPEQALGGLPDRFEPLEPQRQRVRHVLGALPFRRIDVRQQQG